MRSRLWLLLPLTACDASEVAAVVSGGALVVEDFGALGVQTYDDGSSVAYLCGQGDALAESRWMVGDEGLLTDGDYQITTDADGFTTLDGPDRSWSGELVAFEEGGLFSGSPDDCRSGLVAWPTADGWRTLGTWCDAAGAFAQVEPVGTFVPQDRVSVEVVDAATAREFELDRVD